MPVTKADTIHDALRDEIVAGRRAQGSVLDEAELAESFGASRTPVREALRRLQSEGLLTSGSRRQMRVVDLSGHRSDGYRREIALLRVSLEGTAAAEACAVHTDDEIDPLRVAVLRQRRTAATGDVEAFLALDEEFHRALAALARMPTLTLLLDQLGPFVRLARQGVPTDTAHMVALADEHERLLDLLAARDPEPLRAALAEHIHDVGPRERRTTRPE
ncbi:GntR family transcriptional regulator [Pseudonocardia sp. HH130630-07]|uniref:GntR family transcriptional regulator n=1 Tax=Pseudonocardia sp. HH130630-07 TaxID=1690815 RepID=UPI000814D0F6|nr:GntR family transcriptional regulator [Pseudonocardia sp. HH130630-07]ANY08499.1 transcriptional regulator [Pseudonocardia sp. HH130630-07]